MSKSFLDLLPPEEAQKYSERAEKRLEKQRAKKGLDVSPEMFIVGEAGVYLGGWEAMLALRRGYTVVPETKSYKTKDGETVYYTNYVKEPLTLNEAQVMIEAAKKVHYSQVLEQIHANGISNKFVTSASSFNNAIKPFEEKAELKE